MHARFLAAVLTLVLVSMAAPVAAGSIGVSLSSLPSTQGWTPYIESGQPESAIFTVSGGVLHMDSASSTAAYYKVTELVDPALPFTLSARARVLGGSGQTLAFMVGDGTRYAAINLSPTGALDESSRTIIASGDFTVFHDFRMEGDFASGYLLYIDDVLAGGAGFDALEFNGVLFGDSGGIGSGQAQMTAFSFTQSSVPAPGSLSLLLLAAVGLTALRTTRRRR